MGFFNRFKKALRSNEKEDVESRNIANDESFDDSPTIESLENSNERDDVGLHGSEDDAFGDGQADNQTLQNDLRNFRYLDDLIHSGLKEIVLDSDIVLSEDEETAYGEGIEIDVDDLVIEGNGYSIDSVNKTRIFKVDSRVTIRNAKLKNGYAEEGGAMDIHDDGDVILDNCEFSGNVAQRYGGAIVNRGKMCLHETRFIKNKVQEVDGGAINIQRGDVKIDNCEFYGNVAQRYAGALLSHGNLTIAETRFIKNSTLEMDGGAVNIQEGDVEFNNCVFQENVGQRFAGAIVNFANLTISETAFLKNRAHEQKGGAIVNMEM